MYRFHKLELISSVICYVFSFTPGLNHHYDCSKVPTFMYQNKDIKAVKSLISHF